jgi:internalin A
MTGGRPQFQWRKSSSLTYYSLKDFNQFKQCKSLNSLQICGCEDLTDISFLADIYSLTDIDVSGCKNLDDITPLANLPNLKNLNIGRTGVSDLSPLAGLSTLRRLDVYQCIAAGDTQLQSTDQLFICRQL